MHNSRFYNRSTYLVLCGFSLCMSSAALNVQALEYNFAVGNTTLYTTNVGRTEEEEVADLVQIPHASLVASHDTGAVELDAGYRFERRIYREDLFRDRNRFTGSANLLWNALPERLQFFASNTRTEATINSIEQDVEDNRQLVRTSSAGPRLLFNPRGGDQLSLEYRYTLVQEDDSIFFGDEIDADSDRNRFSLAYELGISANRSLTLQASREEVDFDDPGTPDLDIDNASLSYRSNSERLELIVTAGYTDISRSQGFASVNGFVGDATLNWALSGSRDLSINARRNLNDQSRDLLRGTGTFGQRTVIDNSGLNDVFEEDTVGVNYNSRFGRNTFGLAFRYQTQDFATVNRDEDENRFTVRIGRQHTPRVGSSLSASYTQRDFQFTGLTDDFINVAGQIEWQTTNRLRLVLGARYQDRDSSNANLAADLSPIVGFNSFTFNEFSANVSIDFDLVSRVSRR